LFKTCFSQNTALDLLSIIINYESWSDEGPIASSLLREAEVAWNHLEDLYMPQKKYLSFLFCQLVSIALLAGISFSGYAAGPGKDSTEKKMELPSVGAGYGTMSFFGTVGRTSKLHVGSFSGIRPAWHFVVEERLSDLLAVSVNYNSGHVAGDDHNTTDNLNFESKMTQFGADVVFPFDNGIIMKRGSQVVPYLSLGIGFLSYRPFADLLDKKGHPYNYWSDGSIRNLPEGLPGSAILNRDYVYETALSGAKSTIAIPLGLGVRIKLTDHISGRINFAYNYTLAKDIDGVSGAKTNDKYLYTNVSVHYAFGKSNTEEESNKRYDQVDWETIANMDSDGDGVKDTDDKCPGTPRDVVVDETGCPVDTDGDGVPDYLDKEPNTKKGAKVDEHGVKLDFKKIASYQKQLASWDSVYVTRSKAFNASPSMQKLKEIEDAEKKNPRKTEVSKVRIPDLFKDLDKDHNGFISVKELNGAIDSFFSGENTLTVDQVNKLIDFFFEQ
jgi:hypothetical protein